MNVLFICTSGKDRSPALVTYFSATAPKNNYRCAGVNKYFCERKGTHYLTEEDIVWADIVVFAEPVHKEVFNRDFPDHKAISVGGNYRISGKRIIKTALYCQWVILSCGEYTHGVIGDDYLMKADLRLKDLIK